MLKVILMENMYKNKRVSMYDICLYTSNYMLKLVASRVVNMVASLQTYTNTPSYFIAVTKVFQTSSTVLITSPSTEETTPSSLRTTTTVTTLTSPTETMDIHVNTVPTSSPEHNEVYHTGTYCTCSVKA